MLIQHLDPLASSLFSLLAIASLLLSFVMLGSRLLLPYLIWRIIRRLNVGREIHVILQPSTSLVVGAFFVMFALSVSFRVATSFHLELTVAVLALTVMLSMKLIGFLMLAVRHEATSQILGLLVLENGIFLGSQILVPGMPLLIELVILFDLLIVVACFGVLVGYLLTYVGSTSTLDLKRLVG
jgi:hydrogenase-4 component E